MKFLIHSNSPATKTGYGVQTALLAERLHDAGHEVAISATFGQQGWTGTWKPDRPRHPELWDKPLRVYPCGWALNGKDIIHNHALHWFGEPLNGWIIILGDVWSLAENPLLRDFNVAAWAPVDHFPCPPGVLDFFDRSQALPVAMSRFGENAFRLAGLDPVYVPLAVDRTRYKPTPILDHPEQGPIPARDLLGVPDEAFLVGMVAMNKDPDDRKGFNEAFAAFAAFWRRHPDAVLYVHSDPNGMGVSFDLREDLARLHSIPPSALRFSDVYGYQMGWTTEMMAATYTAFDVLLAPSHGEGFCVPLIEAQACGTPVIASDFSAQPELIGAGWKVGGQQFYDAAQKAFYLVPYIDPILEALEEAYQADLDELEVLALKKAQEYDADLVYEEAWAPLVAQMVADPVLPELDRDEPFEVTVVVPAMRAENLARLVASLEATNAPIYDLPARLTIVHDAGFAIGEFAHYGESTGSEATTTYAEKVNIGVAGVETPWVLLVGDDVEFHPGWLEEAAKLADRYDVIGTNDSLPGRIRNPDVAAGKHADHFFVRRSYIDTYGACLDGPGVMAPECYQHWFVDSEVIGLAQARGVFAPCLSSVIEHHHPGYDNQPRDDVYMRAIVHSQADKETYESRRPLIEMQRTTRGRR